MTTSPLARVAIPKMRSKKMRDTALIVAQART